MKSTLRSGCSSENLPEIVGTLHASEKNHTFYLNILNTTRLVIRAEASALEELSSSIGQAFLDVFKVIPRLIGGQAILCGIVKSRHIAQKIAATFSSTCMPALLIHPAEAVLATLG